MNVKKSNKAAYVMINSEQPFKYLATGNATKDADIVFKNKIGR